MNDTTATLVPAENLPAKIPTRRPQEVRVVNDPIAVLDTARFEHMQRVAAVMARSALIPESLYMFGGKDDRQILPMERIAANCFLIVNQAVRWGMDPFAVAQCVSVVHGKLCYEGKLIAAIIKSKLGIRLRYEWNDKNGAEFGIAVSGRYPDDDEVLTVTGTVKEWTKGEKSPWHVMPRMMLAYRGSREWCRLYAPDLMLGVYSDDELSDMADDARAHRARDVTGPGEPPRRAALPAARAATGATDEETWGEGEAAQADAQTAAKPADEVKPADDGKPAPRLPPPPPPRQQPSPQPAAAQANPGGGNDVAPGSAAPRQDQTKLPGGARDPQRGDWPDMPGNLDRTAGRASTKEPNDAGHDWFGQLARKIDQVREITPTLFALQSETLGSDNFKKLSVAGKERVQSMFDHRRATLTGDTGTIIDAG